jgi:hypothetical protein
VVQEEESFLRSEMKWMPPHNVAGEESLRGLDITQATQEKPSLGDLVATAY